MLGLSRLKTLAISIAALPAFWYAISFSGTMLRFEGAGFTAEPLVARLGVFGIGVVAMLSGFGAVNFPYRSMHSLLRPVTHRQVADVEHRLQYTMKLITTRKR